ncbi:hypothetical protein VFPPC_12896 [Pochonia chlamydosporia 170]|uniref:Uncharacterized protein n=1 Tax=Pochonia chlamydosporia 170 TaxID=1380566 RepID=A0A179G525_METCM|nr:hypothetical protein VFPPC_12896 [Pochonia chlamydosporia 170]OAQ72954.1 hypothetical protein VFPPC_12896 [Pochonia chlamydosporia 170]
MESQLLFINKTSSSTLSSKQDEKAKILSHVQSKRRKAEAKSKSAEPWTSFASIIPTTRTKPPKQQSNSKANTVTHHFRLPSSYPSFNASDPFHCTSVHTTPNTHILLQHTFSLASRSNFLAEAFAPSAICSKGRPIRHEAIFHARLRQCIHDQTHMYATLAYGSSLLGWMMGRFQTHPPEYFLSMALPSVRKSLSADCQVDNWLLLSMYALAVTEMWNGIPSMWIGNERYGTVMRMSQYGFAACRVHLRALLALVLDNGGWGAFDPYVLDSVLLADKYLAVSDMSLPVIPVTFDPGPLSALERQRLGSTEDVSEELGQGILEETASLVLKGAVADLVDYCQTAQQRWRLPGMDDSTEAWLFRRLQALLYRFLHMYHDAELGLGDKRVCVATLTFIFGSITGKGPQVSAQQVARTLYAHLLVGDWPNNGLHLWYLVLGAMALGESVERSWFMNRLRVLRVWDLSREEIAMKLKKFLFLEVKQGAQLTALVAELGPDR